MLDESKTTGTAVVVGGGTMGGGIAAQLANAGWRVKLLDVANENSSNRNAAAQAGLDRIVKSRPPLLFLTEYASAIEPGNVIDDLDCMRQADWIVEAIVESMPAKQALLATIDTFAGPATVVTSNTSGLNLAEMSSNCSDSLRSRFFGTHFLNPPRYLKLVEVIPAASSDPMAVTRFVRFAEQVLGHRVVLANDTPGFISTRIWIEHLIETIRLAIEFGLTVEETDYLTGALIGRPKSGTFRMADIVGTDIVCAIARNQFEALPDDTFRNRLIPPAILSDLATVGRLGEKSGAGFYKREGKEILSLDLGTGDYRPRQEHEIDKYSVISKSDIRARIAAIDADRSSREGRFLNALFDSLYAYVSYVGPLTTTDAASVDCVMKWGFQWELGPFGIEAARRSGTEPQEAETSLYFADNSLKPVVAAPEYITIEDLRPQTVLESPVGSLLDMGDGVACLQIRTKMNTFGPELCSFFDDARACAERQFLALVIGSAAPYFSAGFNLKLFLEAAPREDWAAIDAMLHQVQSTFMALKYSPIPSVAAVRGYTLGGGCECAFACSAIQASPELVMGLPELPAGLIPAGGAFKELLHRTFAGWDSKSDPFARADGAVDYIVAHQTSSCAAHAKKLGLLRGQDSISRNGDRLLFDAKRKAIGLANDGYSPPVKSGVWAVGAPGLARMRLAINEHCNAKAAISEHDRLVADRAAYVMCGGPLTAPQYVSEEYMLNLERQVFLTLVREPKSLARIKHLLETGKPLAN